jgi:hypothetical protein
MRTLAESLSFAFIRLLTACAPPTANLASPADDGVTVAEARRVIEEGNLAWGRARVTIDQEAFERALAATFYAKLPERRLTRAEFIERITHFPAGRITRFDPMVLTVQREGDTWVAIIMEKLECDRPGVDGKLAKGYTLAVTRDGWKKMGTEWKILFSELISAEMWRDGSRPPMASW